MDYLRTIASAVADDYHFVPTEAFYLKIFKLCQIAYAARGYPTESITDYYDEGLVARAAKAIIELQMGKTND